LSYFSENIACNSPLKFWYAFYTKPRHEFKAALQLESISVKHYLPTITRIRQWHDRKKKITEPLFRGYIFVYCNEKERLIALEQKAIIRTISFMGVPAKIPDWQIENVKKMLDENEDLKITKIIKIGTPVKIINGPFAGIEGLVYKSENNEKMLAVSIDLLRRSVVVRLPAASVIESKTNL
jgi:transcription antitermination factor NusG